MTRVPFFQRCHVETERDVSEEAKGETKLLLGAAAVKHMFEELTAKMTNGDAAAALKNVLRYF